VCYHLCYFNAIKRNASKRSSESSIYTNAQVDSHAPTFAKVCDGRKQPVRGLWQRGARFYAQLKLSVEDFSTGEKRVRRVPLVNSDGNPVEAVPQAIAELNRPRTLRSDDTLPKLGRTPTWPGSRPGRGQEARHHRQRGKHVGALENHLGGIRLDKIRPAHVAGFMKKRLAAEKSRRTVMLDIIALRNVLKQARDVEEYITELPISPGIDRELKSIAPTRELFTLEELETLCQAAMAAKTDGTPVTKNGQQFTDYVRLMAYCGAGRNETLALRWADVDFKREQLTIGAEGNTKNSTSRTVDFNPALKNHLLARAFGNRWNSPALTPNSGTLVSMTCGTCLLASASCRELIL
jgi:hypothetical protein